MKEINIIQFLPYFPPHKWWLETVSEEFSKYYVKNDFWNVINIVFDVWQEINKISENDLIKYKGEIIWYKKDGYIVYLLPAFDIIPNFPVPKFWKKVFWRVLKGITPTAFSKLPPQWGGFKGELSKNNIIVQTHTRFFLSSFLGWIFAKYHNLKWVHVEHGSDYVKLWSKFKSKISYFYDKTIWKWIFKKCDSIVAISNWVKEFIQKEFVNREVWVIYNWIDFHPWEKIINQEVVKIWFVWRLVKLKWVDLLIETFLKLEKEYKNIFLEIVWDGEERVILEKLSWNSKNIRFLWFKDREYIAKEFLPKIDILVNPSFQEWLPTIVLEWLLAKCIVVATNAWGTSEISQKDDLIIIDKWGLNSLEKWLKRALLNYKDISWISFEIIKNDFNWDENIKKYFSLYNDL